MILPRLQQSWLGWNGTIRIPTTLGHVMRPAQITRILDHEFQSADSGYHTPVMLWGPPGVGKSDMVRQIAARHAVPVVDLRLSQMEPSDLRGIPFRQGDSVQWAVPAMLPHSDQQGVKGILFLDEITSAPPTVSAAAYQLVLDRRLGDYRVPPGWAIFSAGNHQGDRGISYAMPAPLANRFTHFDVDVHLEDWVSWAWDQGIDERVIGFLRFRPDRLFEFDPNLNPSAFPTPRSWEFTHRALQKFAQQTDLLAGAVQACVGPAAGIELLAYIRNIEQLPNVEAILVGENVPVPSDLDLQYAVATAIVGRLRKADRGQQRMLQLNHVLDYAKKFPVREMAVMLVVDLHRTVGRELFAASGFQSWSAEVADMLLPEAG